MEIFISNIKDISHMFRLNGITHILSVISRDELDFIKLPKEFDRNNWLLLYMDDMIDINSPLAPTKNQIETILKWGKTLPSNANVLVHCFAGISRSTACALALKVQEIGIAHINECSKWLVNQRPNACPNPVITWHADELLSANGILFKHSEDIANARIAASLKA